MNKFLSKNKSVLSFEAIIILISLLILYATMPKYEYKGDPEPIRFSAGNLIENHTFSFNEQQKKNLPDYFFETFGGNFFYNSNTHEFYSKWGWFNTLLFTPPLIAKKFFFPGNISDELWILILNLYNLFWSLIFIIAFLKTIQLFTNKWQIISIILLGTLFGSFCWNYLRAQTTEIFILCFFQLTLYFSLLYFRNRKNKTLTLSLFFLLLLILVKNVFIIMLPLYYVFIFKYKLIEDQTNKFFISTAVLILIIFFLGNYWQFGNIFETGYSQQAQSVPNFSWDIYRGLWGFLFKINRSIFLHAPFSIIAVLTYKTLKNAFPVEYSFITALFIVFYLMFSTLHNWEGDWSYGPRFLLFIVPAIALLTIPFFDWIFSNKKQLFKLLLLFTLTLSITNQIYVNTLSFFSSHSIRDAFYKIYKEPEIETYFNQRTIGQINAQLIKCYQGDCSFFPIHYIQEKHGLLEAKKIETLIVAKKKYNYLFL